MRPTKHTYSGLQLLRHLIGEEGLNIFSFEQAKKASLVLHINLGYLAEILHHLQKEGWIWRLKRGLYAVTGESGLGTSPHEYEIAMALVHPSAISHWTAMHYHHLTQQTPNKIYALTPTGTPIPRSLPRGRYQYVQVKKDQYFGFEKVWVEHSQVTITNIERTLLDGLIAPQYCGDFQEVLQAFKSVQQQLNLEKIVAYALRLDTAIAKRLGWILEKMEIKESILTEKILAIPIRGYRKLDPSGSPEGSYNKKWKIRENIGG